MTKMKLKVLPYELTVCKVAAPEEIDMKGELFFIGKTDGEVSLVCETDAAPEKTLERSDGWRGMRVEGTLDFSLVGVLAGLTAALAERGIPVFAVSTYDTDYLLVKADQLENAAAALTAAGYAFC